LTGLEQRGCWQERPLSAASQTTNARALAGRSRGPAGAEDDAWATPGLDFIPVELVGHAPLLGDPATDGGPALTAAAEAEPDQIGLTLAAKVDEGWTERTSLFGEPEA
jgi:hypothetical protein